MLLDLFLVPFFSIFCLSRVVTKLDTRQLFTARKLYSIVSYASYCYIARRHFRVIANYLNVLLSYKE